MGKVSLSLSGLKLAFWWEFINIFFLLNIFSSISSNLLIFYSFNPKSIGILEKKRKVNQSGKRQFAIFRSEISFLVRIHQSIFKNLTFFLTFHLTNLYSTQSTQNVWEFWKKNGKRTEVGKVSLRLSGLKIAFWSEFMNIFFLLNFFSSISSN